MKIFTPLLILSCLGLLDVARAAEPLPTKEKFHLFLLAGQSNMAGRGKIDDAGRQPHPHIVSLNAAGEWQPATDPLHWDKPSAAAGLGKPFAEIVAEKDPAIRIGLIPAACGGSPVSAWQPGRYFAGTKSHPYDDAITRAKRAMQDGTLRAILWHQGESDATDKDAGAYEQRLEALFARLRAELGAPELPIVIGQIGRFPGKSWDEAHEKVNAAHQALARRLKNVRYVSAEGLTSIGDELHFDTPSLRTFARGYAEAYLAFSGTRP